MANLVAVRTDFIETSRRWDLVVNHQDKDFTDNGADKFIKEGSKYLDRTVEHPGLVRRNLQNLAIGSFQLIYEDLIDVRAIYVKTATTINDITDKRIDDDFIKACLATPIADWDSGEPSKWGLNTHLLAPEQAAETSSTFTAASIVDFEDIEFTELNNLRKKAIIFNVKADAVYTIDLQGKFHSFELALDADTNFWSENHSQLLVLAACYTLERTYSNTSRMRTWLEAMQPEIDAIDRTAVEMELSGTPMFMEG